MEKVHGKASLETHRRQDAKELYDKLNEEKVLPEIARENEKELTVNEPETIASVLKEKVAECNEHISMAGDVSERKVIRKRRKLLNEARKLTEGYAIRKKKYTDILEGRNRETLITYGIYKKERTRKYKKDPSNTGNWDYDEASDSYTCPNGKQLSCRHLSRRTDGNGFSREFKAYESNDCTSYHLRNHTKNPGTTGTERSG